MSEQKKEKRASLYEFNQKYGDPWIWGIFIMLIVISIVENYSASSREIADKGVLYPMIKHSGFLIVGAAITFIIAKRDYNKPLFLAIIIPGLSILTVASLVYVSLFGKVINGAQRAIYLMGFTFQPAECAKLSIVTLLAYLLAVYQKDKGLTTKGLMWACGAVALYCGLMIRSGLTNCAILLAICVTMLLIGGAQLKKIALVASVSVVLGGCGMLIKSAGDKNDQVIQSAETEVGVSPTSEGITTDEDNDKAAALAVAPGEEEKKDPKKVDRWAMRVKRVKDWWNNDSLVYWAVTSENQQEVFSRMAQAHGGITGVGLGQSRECARLPLAFSDYIFSIIVEEIGFVGGFFLMVLYLSLLGRAFIIVRKCSRALPSLLIIGLASFITYQALVHMAINTGVFPVSGQPLPLISSGGTAILVMSAAFGIMLSVSRTIAVNKDAAAQAQEPELPEGLDAENPIQINPTPRNIWK